MKCPECGGVVELRAREGRTFRYRKGYVEVPKDIPIPECDGCGEQYIGEALAVRLDKVFSEIYDGEA